MMMFSCGVEVTDDSVVMMMFGCGDEADEYEWAEMLPIL